MARSHLNGSLNLRDAEDVFRTVVDICGDSVARLPDGETGERIGWIEVLGPHLRESPDLIEHNPVDAYKAQPQFSLREGLSYDDFEFPSLGYADAARVSYEVFTRMRDEGVIAKGVRFMVALATVSAGVGPFIVRGEHLRAEPAYARALKRELDEILEFVPQDQLAIQWDLAVEMGIIEGMHPTYIEGDKFDGVVTRMIDLGSWVPEDVELGYHLCYGDAQAVTGEGEGYHWMEPKDAGQMVKLINALVTGVDRQIDWFSLPVPIDRDDDAYYEPLADLETEPDTEIYLGLVHHQDGVEGTQRRIEVAKKHLPEFGVCTECGMGRKPSELAPKLLKIQAAVEV